MSKPPDKQLKKKTTNILLGNHPVGRKKCIINKWRVKKKIKKGVQKVTAL